MVNEATPGNQAAALAATVAADERAATTAPVPAWMAEAPTGRPRQPQRLPQPQDRRSASPRRNRNQRPSKRTATPKGAVRVSDPEAVGGRDQKQGFRPSDDLPVLDDPDPRSVLASEGPARHNGAGLLATTGPRAQDLLGPPREALLADTSSAGGRDLATAAEGNVRLDAPRPGDGDKEGKQLPKSRSRRPDDERTAVCPEGHRSVYQGASAPERWGTEAVVLSS